MNVKIASSPPAWTSTSSGPIAELLEMEDGAADAFLQHSLGYTEPPGDSGLRKAAASIFYRLLRHLSDVDIPLDTGDFRLLSRRRTGLHR